MSEPVLAEFSVKEFKDPIKMRPKRRAALHGTSMEADVRETLRDAVKHEVPLAGPGFGSQIAARFKGGGLSEPLPVLRGHKARPADFKA